MTGNIALTRIFHFLNKPRCDENTKTLQTYLYRNISLTAGHKKEYRDFGVAYINVNGIPAPINLKVNSHVICVLTVIVRKECLFQSRKHKSKEKKSPQLLHALLNFNKL